MTGFYYYNGSKSRHVLKKEQLPRFDSTWKKTVLFEKEHVSFFWKKPEV
jgi:hypothetical protein